MIRWIHETAKRRILLVALGATIVFSSIMMLLLLPQFLSISGGLLPLDMRLTYTPQDANFLFGALGDDGIFVYRLFQLCDTGFPIALAITLSSGIVMVNRRNLPSDHRLRVVAAVPFLTAAFDYAENLLVWSQLNVYPSTLPQVLLLASVISVIKLVLLFTSVGLALVWAVIYIMKRRES
ncbi:hypothetical protein EU538_03995 [Candidatus Thorarchaeota archaeon]|nr:MAG: hypothetical protein EU538_03995 [Candidatus Thorarchaeota archaeon]